jgi:raffinose/stachyose/melibiose transport system substrate-binding protein
MYFNNIFIKYYSYYINKEKTMEQRNKAGMMALVGLLMLGILACSGKKTEARTDSGPVEIFVTSWRSEDIDPWNRVNGAFMKAFPDIKVTYTPVINTEYDTYLMTSLQSGTAPDVIHSRNDESGMIVYEGGYFEPLTEELIPNLKTLPQSYKQHFTAKDGVLFACPTDFITHGCIYNKDIFTKYNLSEPETWEEFLQVCRILKQNGVTPLAIGTKDEWTLSNMLTNPISGNFGGEQWRMALIEGKDDFLNPDFVAHFQAIKDLQPYLPNGFIGIGYTDTQQLFLAGQAAFFVAGSFELPFFENNDPDFEMGIFPIPVSKKGDVQHVTYLADIGQAINKAASHKNEAAVYINWLASKEGSTQIAEVLPGFFPVQPEVKDYSNPLAKEWAGWIKPDGSNLVYWWNGTVIGLNGKQPEAYGLSGIAITKMWTENISARQAAQFVQDGIIQWYEPLQKYIASKK